MKSYTGFYKFEDAIIHHRFTLTELKKQIKDFIMDNDKLTVGTRNQIDKASVVSGKDLSVDVVYDDSISFNIGLSFGDAYIDIYVLPTNEEEDGEMVYYITEVAIDGADWKITNNNEE